LIKRGEFLGELKKFWLLEKDLVSWRQFKLWSGLLFCHTKLRNSCRISQQRTRKRETATCANVPNHFPRTSQTGKPACRQSSVCNMDIHDMTPVTDCKEFYLRVDIKVKYKCCTLLSLHKKAKHEKESRYPRSFSCNGNSKLIRIAAQRGCLINQTAHNPSKT